MKKLKLLLIVFAAILLTGCYKFEGNMTIGEDKKVTFEMIYALINMGDSLQTDSDSSIDCDKTALDLGEGWSSEKYNDDKYIGCKFSKKYNSIDDISSDKEVIVELSNIGDSKFNDTQLFKKTDDKYEAHFKFSMKDKIDNNEDESNKDMTESMLSMFELKYTVTLPQESLSNNATKVENDGKTLIWELEPTKNTDIEYSFKIDNTINTNTNKDIPWLYIGIGAGVLIVVIVITLCTKSKKCNCDNCNCDNKIEENKENN